MINLNCQLDRILYQIFKIILSILTKHGEDIDKATVQISVNKIENKVTFKIKNGYSFELLTQETMKLPWSSENKITKHKNGENVPHLEITEVVLVHCNIVNNDYQQDSRVLHMFVPNKPFYYYYYYYYYLLLFYFQLTKTVIFYTWKNYIVVANAKCRC